jgi:hypothetical protein
MSATILWRCLDEPGHDSARLERHGAEWYLSGTAVFVHQGAPCRLAYHVVCDAEWRTVSARVRGWVGSDEVSLDIAPDASGSWTLNGQAVAGVRGCIDVDLNFTPCTNLLPIRRLALEIGQEAPVRAAWLRFPDFTLEPLEQRYHRVAESRYAYESGGDFTAELAVDASGFVTRYGNLWEAEGIVIATEDGG